MTYRSKLIAIACIGLAMIAPASARPSPPAWAAGLGMSDLEKAIDAHIDMALARRDLSPAAAQSLKARVAALRADEQARRAALNFPPAEFNRINGELLKLAEATPEPAPVLPASMPQDPGLQISGPAWAAGLGTRDLEAEIGARADDAVAHHKLDPTRAEALKDQVRTLRADEQARRAALDFPPAEFDRIETALLKLASQVPELPPLHSPEEAPTALGWTEPASPTPLDLTGYHATFGDEFDRLNITADGGKGPWYAPVHSSFGEAQFEPPGPAGPFKIVHGGPLGIGGSALAISANRDKGGWRSGLIQTLDSHGRGFAQQYGYFEMRAKLPKGQATWPAFWLLTQNGLTDPTVTRGEIDVLEQYGSSPEKIHSSVHLWPAAARNAGGLPGHWYKSEKIPVGDMSSAFHRYGVMLTPQWVITYYDGLETSRFPMLAQYRTPVYMLVDLTMHPKGLAQATNPSVMLVDYVKAYAKR